jgi:hypothetical protein
MALVLKLQGLLLLNSLVIVSAMLHFVKKARVTESLF